MAAVSLTAMRLNQDWSTLINRIYNLIQDLTACVVEHDPVTGGLGSTAYSLFPGLFDPTPHPKQLF